MTEWFVSRRNKTEHAIKSTIHFPASKKSKGNWSIYFSADIVYKQFGPDQARRYVGPDLDPNCLTLWWYSCNTCNRKSWFWKQSADDKKHEKLPSRKRVQTFWPLTWQRAIFEYIPTDGTVAPEPETFICWTIHVRLTPVMRPESYSVKYKSQ